MTYDETIYMYRYCNQRYVKNKLKRQLKRKHSLFCFGKKTIQHNESRASAGRSRSRVAGSAPQGGNQGAGKTMSREQADASNACPLSLCCVALLQSSGVLLS